MSDVDEFRKENPRLFPPWCIWNHSRKCPDKRFFCSSEEHRACEHHRKHGDMDGHTCLLGKCALHYPRTKDEEATA